MDIVYTNAVRDLKAALLDTRSRSASSRMLDCAAHMLLYFDDPAAMHRIALTSLLDRFGATRADFGYGSPAKSHYVPTAIATVTDLKVPHFEGALPNQMQQVQEVWQSSHPVVISIPSHPTMRTLWVDLGLRSKLARRVEVDGSVFGLLCIDDTDQVRTWETADVEYLNSFVLDFLGPILCAQMRAAKPALPAQLTSAEIAVVRLAAAGLSYKEIARRIGKSRNTIDNQLRSARTKLNVRNQVELVQACQRWL
jgi:DNA-binding CsgD family transcriptional regulator